MAPNDGLDDRIGSLHEGLATVDCFLAGMHVQAALARHDLRHDSTPVRMLPHLQAMHLSLPERLRVRAPAMR